MDFDKHGVGNKQGGWKTKMDFDKFSVKTYPLLVFHKYM